MDGKPVTEYVEEQNLQGVAFDEIVENVVSFYDYQEQFASGVVADILMDLDEKACFD
jgi:hypothetical protein